MHDKTTLRDALNKYSWPFTSQIISILIKSCDIISRRYTLWRPWIWIGLNLEFHVYFYYSYCTAPFTRFKELGIPGPEATPVFGNTAYMIFKVNWVLMCLLSQTSAGQMLVYCSRGREKERPWERGCREGGPVTRSKFKYHRKWSRIQQAIVGYSPTGARWINGSDLIDLHSYEVKIFQAGTDTPWCNYNFCSFTVLS